jgi:hypothetical protein
MTAMMFARPNNATLQLRIRRYFVLHLQFIE